MVVQEKYRNVCGTKLKDKKTFLIGGGSSLTGFDFEKLKSKGHVIVINDALARIPWADSFFTEDYRWLVNRKEMLKSFKGTVYLAVPEDKAPCNISHYLLKRKYTEGFSEELDEVYLGGNSGFGAFNLAYILGATEIYLLGYDFCVSENGKKHFHDGYTWDSPAGTRYFKKWALNFRFAFPYIKERGVKVLNCSEDSAIDCFEKISLTSLEQHIKE